jgi:hypothetical protein
MIVDEVRRHYLTLWGEPSRKANFRVLGHTVHVYKWDAERNPEQVNIYATVGASAYELPGREPAHRMEFFVGLNPAQDAIAKPLAMVALDAVVHGTELDHGHSITYPDPLWPGTDMHSLLVLRPVMEIVPPLVRGDGKHVDFMQVIPVFASEVAFKAERRTDALLERWRAANVPFWNPNRWPEPSAAA